MEEVFPANGHENQPTLDFLVEGLIWQKAAGQTGLTEGKDCRDLLAAALGLAVEEPTSLPLGDALSPGVKRYVPAASMEVALQFHILAEALPDKRSKFMRMASIAAEIGQRIIDEDRSGLRG